MTTLKLKDTPASERPRERLVELGPDALSHAELIAILLRTGLKGANAVDVARQLVSKFGSLRELAGASVEELQSIRGIGRDKAVTLIAAFTLARKMAAEFRLEGPVLDHPEVVVALLREEIRLVNAEVLMVILLNTRLRLIRIEQVSKGGLNMLSALPREIFKPAIVANAASVIVAHNHPSGDPTPSQDDINLTRDLVRAGALLRIPLADHLILGRSSCERTQDFVSLKQMGYVSDS
jgi:DNA repair protein RadC